MVFGMISDLGTRPLVRLHCKINEIVYKEILKKHVVPNLRSAINQPAVFMQGNSLCHTAKSFKTFLSEIFFWRMIVLWSGLLKDQT